MTRRCRSGGREGLSTCTPRDRRTHRSREIPFATGV